jgi:exopolyphosphatase/guanosine-5'-triphosphate,3'-diphosphate pyrophosphatase
MMINELTARLNPRQLEIWLQSLALAKACKFEEGHSYQVIHLALRLFDDLVGLHQYGETERFQLQLAGLLHDIGWVEGWKEHHKTSLNIILTSPMLPFDNRERQLIGSLCRYHRKALPDVRHDHYAALDEADRFKVSRLAALLRVADGLDCTHRSLVTELYARVDPKTIGIDLLCSAPAIDEQRDGLKKGNLIEIAYQRKLIIEWKVV